MKQLCLILIVSLSLLTPGCKRKGDDPATAKCNEALGTIPEMADFLRVHRGPISAAPLASLQGVQIALTVHWSVESETNPAEKEDDWCYPASSEDKLNHFLEALKENRIPPTVNFVVGSSLDSSVEERWLKNGNIAGSLTFNRPRPKANASSFIDDISKNDALLVGLWAKYPPPQKYFRYPGFRTPDDPGDRQTTESYLEKAGYTTVPATIDAKDDKFAQIYCAATARGDSTCASVIVDDYYQLLRDSITRARTAASKTAGHDIKQIMVVETNKFTCDNLKEILARLKTEGVHFIKLDDALRDSFYAGSGAEANDRALAILAKVRDEQLGKTEGE
jgi:hypothetical protein